MTYNFFNVSKSLEILFVLLKANFLFAGGDLLFLFLLQTTRVVILSIFFNQFIETLIQQKIRGIQLSKFVRLHSRGLWLPFGLKPEGIFFFIIFVRNLNDLFGEFDKCDQILSYNIIHSIDSLQILRQFNMTHFFDLSYTVLYCLLSLNNGVFEETIFLSKGVNHFRMTLIYEFE